MKSLLFSLSLSNLRRKLCHKIIRIDLKSNFQVICLGVIMLEVGNIALSVYTLKTS